MQPKMDVDSDALEDQAPVRRGADIMHLLSIVVFALGISAFAFAYGVIVGMYGYFPYEMVRDAMAAAEALHDKYFMPAEPYALAVNHDKAGVTIYDSNRAFNGYTFLTAYRDGRNKAVLLDMQGNVLHEWRADFSDVWPDAAHII